jgi:hypothetical protein
MEDQLRDNVNVPLYLCNPISNQYHKLKELYHKAVHDIGVKCSEIDFCMAIMRLCGPYSEDETTEDETYEDSVDDVTTVDEIDPFEDFVEI